MHALHLRNAFMHNYAEVEGCSVLLDIGSKTTNVIFVEGDQFFVRSINFGANSITQEFSSESSLEHSLGLARVSNRDPATGR